jgi:hypothetical protein
LATLMSVAAFALDRPLAEGGDDPRMKVVAQAGNARFRLVYLDDEASTGFVPVDENDNRIGYHVILPPRAACDTGTIVTWWSGVGTEHGLMFSDDGELVGYVRGLWGTRANGLGVFYWKVIDLDGSFQGFVAGAWGSGLVAARHLDADLTINGGLLGFYGSRGLTGGGYTLARWGKNCDWLPNEGTTETDDEANEVVEESLTVEQ